MIGGRDSGHYDEEAPRHLRIDRLRLQSTYTTPNIHYAVGAMQGNELHLTPVAGIYQVRRKLFSCGAVGAR